MKVFIVLCCAVAFGCAGANLLKDLMAAEWQAYKAEYGKEYDSRSEELARFRIYAENKIEIDEHNQKYAEGKVTYEMGLNEFSDWTFEEFAEKMLMTNTSLDFQLGGYIDDEDYVEDYMEPLKHEAPAEVDWRKIGAVTGVKNQRHCGSCWAFAATGTIEGQWYRKTQKLVSLSEQNLLDCSRGSCNGYWPTKALQYVINNGGIDTEESYRYSATKRRCRYSRRNVGAQITGVKRVHSEQQLLSAVANVGPVAIAIGVDRGFMHYRRGTYSSRRCAHSRSLHAILAVGYNTTSKNDQYWIVKNSWGSSWGDEGYVHLQMFTGVCGLGRYENCYTVV